MTTTRFAPSPTGYLHLGHVVNALYVWTLARLAGGRVLLRIEDHDRIRSRPEFERAILEDLAWLGFVPDEGLDPVVRQSDRGERYLSALRALQHAHNVYVCDCSRRDIVGECYPGTCRARRLPPDAPLPADAGVRVELDTAAEVFCDLSLGRRVQTPAEQCGDLLLRDRDGNWTYQFAVTVDDLDDGVDLVIRGQDLVESTGRQIKLARMLGRRDRAAFFHHKLLLDGNGEKLSKSTSATGIRELRAAGVEPEEVIRRVRIAAGLKPGGNDLNQ